MYLNWEKFRVNVAPLLRNFIRKCSRP